MAKLKEKYGEIIIFVSCEILLLFHPYIIIMGAIIYWPPIIMKLKEILKNFFV